MSFEIQITTEMQYILHGLTHIFYEKERHQESTRDEAWKWKYNTSRFAASYISHSLHLLEGMILRLYEDVTITSDLSKVSNSSSNEDEDETQS